MHEKRAIQAMSDFDLIVQNAWARMFAELDALKQQSLQTIKLRTLTNPTPLQLSLTRTPPNYTLLGMYYDSTITLFEEPIQEAAQQQGVSVDEIAEQVMRHEVWQHHLGANHTVRPNAPKSLDEVYRTLDEMPAGQINYEYSRPTRCCPDRGW
jgi:hypothetical protein